MPNKRIGALWKTRKQGWITGNIEISLTDSIKVGIGVNEKKRPDSRDPDFYIYLLTDGQQRGSETPPEESEEAPF